MASCSFPHFPLTPVSPSTLILGDIVATYYELDHIEAALNGTDPSQLATYTNTIEKLPQSLEKIVKVFSENVKLVTSGILAFKPLEVPSFEQYEREHPFTDKATLKDVYATAKERANFKYLEVMDETNQLRMLILPLNNVASKISKTIAHAKALNIPIDPSLAVRPISTDGVIFQLTLRRPYSDPAPRLSVRAPDAAPSSPTVGSLM